MQPRPCDQRARSFRSIAIPPELRLDGITYLKAILFPWRSSGAADERAVRQARFPLCETMSGLFHHIAGQTPLNCLHAPLVLARCIACLHAWISVQLVEQRQVIRLPRLEVQPFGRQYLAGSVCHMIKLNDTKLVQQPRRQLLEPALLDQRRNRLRLA